MEIGCADCGCIVDAGVRVVPCGTPDCCCCDLPVRSTDLGDDSTENLEAVSSVCPLTFSLRGEVIDWAVPPDVAMSGIYRDHTRNPKVWRP